MRISDWSSDVCSSDLPAAAAHPDDGIPALLQQRAQHPGVLFVRLQALGQQVDRRVVAGVVGCLEYLARGAADGLVADHQLVHHLAPVGRLGQPGLFLDGGQLDELRVGAGRVERSEEHTSELQSLMRISYAVFCLKNKTNKKRRKLQR